MKEIGGEKKITTPPPIHSPTQHAQSRAPLDASRWTPKGETNALRSRYVQKAYQFDVGDTVSVFLGGE